MEQQQETLTQFLKNIVLTGQLNHLVYKKGKQLFENGSCHLMTNSTDNYDYLVKDDYEDFQTKIIFKNGKISFNCSCLSPDICSHAFAVANQTSQELSRSLQLTTEGVKKYSRQGMISRVVSERKERAKAENYHLEFSDNIYGEHQIINEQGKLYEISFYDFNKKSGYCSCPDYQTNKLETCKHLIYAFSEFNKNHSTTKLPAQTYPFLEIYRHPSFDYQIAWFYPHQVLPNLQMVLDEFFDQRQLFKLFKLNDLHLFIEKIQDYKTVKIRPEVLDFIQKYYEETALKDIFEHREFNTNTLLKKLYPFQKKGIEFLGKRKGCILADEIGTGKTIQALGTALYKKEVLGIEKIKIVSPKHLLDHWNFEIKKWIPQRLISSFIIESFEDLDTNTEVDFLIIDEAQKITDYDSSLLQQLHKIPYKHILLVTDSKIENSLIKFYAMVGLIDKYLLTPLWELSYKHCLFNPANPNEIVGYYNLDKISKKLETVYIRREKEDIHKQLPETNKIIIPIPLNDILKTDQYHLCGNILKILKKKNPNSYDLIRLKNQLKQLLDIGKYNASYLQKEKNAPKFSEFRHAIQHKLILNNKEKVVIFIDKKELQQQVKNILNQENKTVEIIKKDQKNFDDNIQFYISSEQLQNNLPKAHHFIYFHIPEKHNAINERIRSINKQTSGIQQNKLYLLQSANSLESVLYKWHESKPYLLEQISHLLSSKNASLTINLRLHEELSHELKALLLLYEKNSNKIPTTQTDLFGETVLVEKTSTPIGKGKPNQNLEHFIQYMMKNYTSFDLLNTKQKELIAKGKLHIEEKNDEIVIRIKPPLNK